MHKLKMPQQVNIAKMRPLQLLPSHNCKLEKANNTRTNTIWIMLINAHTHNRILTGSIEFKKITLWVLALETRLEVLME